jgi:non-ribosomal peptide synthetase component F
MAGTLRFSSTPVTLYVFRLIDHAQRFALSRTKYLNRKTLNETFDRPSFAGGGVLSRTEDIEQSITTHFEKQVHRVPDQIAVESGGRTLSYAALNRSAPRQ